MRRFRVLQPRGVHSMSAGRSWYLNQYVLEGEVPERLIDVWVQDGAIVEEFDTAPEPEPEPEPEAEPEPEPKPRSRKPKAGA